MRAACLLAAIVFCSAPAFGQATFEAASIKRSQADEGHSGVQTNKRRISMENVTLKRCIRTAYDVPDAQILGGPDWLDDARFDVIAKAETAAVGREMVPMLQALLAERFQLSVHREPRSLQGYALVAGTGALKARPSAPDAQSGTSSRSNNSKVSMQLVACTMARFAERLSDFLHVPVVDLTEIKGPYDFRLEWAPEDLRATSTDAPTGPSLFSAIQEQVGLRLEARRVPTQVLVVDHAEPPSEN
jgi:uncharacterized protein (TIGR03435 family)